jgi:hypothetical protein
MTEQRLFISHANEDSAVADRIVAYLETRGVPCWISSRDIPPRAIYADAITEAMRACSACAVLLSAASNQSKAVKRELELASHYDKPFIPIRLDASEPAAGVDYYLRNTQWTDYRRGGEQALERIITQMNGSAPPRSPLPIRRNAILPMLILVVVVLAAGGAWFGLSATRNNTDASLRDLSSSSGGAQFDVYFPNRSFSLESVATEISGKVANLEDVHASIAQTCQLEADQQLEDQRTTAVFTALRMGGVPADNIAVEQCERARSPSLPSGVVRVSLVWPTTETEDLLLLAGSYNWDGRVCGDGPSVTVDGNQLIFEMVGTPTYRHEVRNVMRSWDASGALRELTATTQVVEPTEHSGERYSIRATFSTAQLRRVNQLDVHNDAAPNAAPDSWDACTPS